MHFLESGLCGAHRNVNSRMVLDQWELLYAIFFHFRPDNLRVLFRPIAMMKPDVAIIAQVTLYAGGFENAEMLAKKIVTIFSICAELLPPRDFYDFGKSSSWSRHRKNKPKYLPFIDRLTKSENRSTFVLQAEV